MIEPRKVPVAHIQRMVRTLEFTYARVDHPDGTPSTTTACWAYLPNGFQVGYGSSGCVNPADFNQSLGEHEAHKRAVADATNNLWLFEGYMMKQTGKHSGEHNES